MLELDKNIAVVIDDMKANKANWIVSGVQRDSSNQLVKVTLTPLKSLAILIQSSTRVRSPFS